jgi:hypothetical protein
LCDLLIGKSAVYTSPVVQDNWKGLWQGSLDCFEHWWLVMRCAWIGSVIGAIPGIGSSVIDWISYGHALKTEKGAKDTFGKGDVRGVIAAESATCSREGGALIPTVVFGVPGSAGMAILLGAFLMHGLIPGPDMLTTNLSITYSMVWSIAIANILGSGLCYLFSSQFAKFATLRYTLILPFVLSLVYIGAFEGQRDWGDLYSLLIFGVFAWITKHAKWPRPPLVLGFILGKILERYMFISIERYGVTWMKRPVVVILFLMAAFSLLLPFIKDVRAHGGLRGMLFDIHAPKFHARQLFPLSLLILFAVMMSQALEWNYKAAIIPLIVGTGAIVFCTLSLLNDLLKSEVHEAKAVENASLGIADEKMHLDIASNVAHLPTKTLILRAGIFFGWMLGFMGSMALIGLIPTVPLFIVAFMRIEGRERWTLVAGLAAFMTCLVYGVFDQLLTIPWPATVLGDHWLWWKTHIPSA